MIKVGLGLGSVSGLSSWDPEKVTVNGTGEGQGQVQGHGQGKVKVKVKVKAHRNLEGNFEYAN